MGRKYARLCLGRPRGCFRVRRQRRTSSFASSTATAGQTAELMMSTKVMMITNNDDHVDKENIQEREEENEEEEEEEEKRISGNKIMVVVDSSIEAKGGLEWAISHTVQTQDTLVLLHVSDKSDSKGKVNNLRATELLHSMKNTCERKRPGVKVEIELLQGNEKGPIIVEAAKRQKVSLLVLGQKRKRSIWWSLMKIWTKKGKRREVADYCVENAQCMTIVVRQKNKKLGGYLITTKRHKNFWLLA